jgi:hypothetical protein
MAYGVTPGERERYQAALTSAEQRARDLAEEDRRRMLDLTEGEYRRSLEDPYLETALGAIEGGMEGPYTEEVRSALLSQITDQAAAAEEAALQSIQRGAVARGGTMYDPSAQAAARRASSQRQTGVQGATRDVQMQAALENYAARQQAAQNLAGVRTQQRATAQPLAQQASRQYQETVRDVEKPQAPTPQWRSATRKPMSWQQQINQAGMRQKYGI